MEIDDTIKCKTCRKCRREKPATESYFQAYKITTGIFHLRHVCRLCRGVKTEGIITIRRELNLSPEERRDRNNLLRRERYRINKNTILLRVREKRRLNPEKYREWDKQNYVKNINQKRDYKKRQWAECDKKLRGEKVKRWLRENPEKAYLMWRRTYEKHKSKHHDRGKRWARLNPEARSAIVDRRRARMVGASGVDYTKNDIRSILKQQDCRCFYCFDILTKFHADHFIPLARGGTNEPDNIRLCCPSCNYSKSSRMPWDWMPERFEKPKIER